MKIWLFSISIVLSGFLVPSIAQDRLASSNSLLFDPLAADRMILVAFEDRHIKRINSGGIANAYRRRGPYRGSTWSQGIGDDLAEKYRLAVLANWPVTELGVHCVVYQVLGDRTVDEVTARLAEDTRLSLIQKMNVFQTMAAKFTDPYYELQPSLQAIQLDRVHQKTTGKNVSIALIDTGLDIEHPDLSGQITAKKNFATPISPDFLEDIHGTTVAGVIAAHANNNAGIVGIAPNSELIALKACWPRTKGTIDAVCNSFTLALAINTAIKMKVDILNLSLSGPEDPLLKALINRAIERGIIVVAAEPDEPQSKHRFPASMENVIAVRSREFSHAKTESSGRTISAPGDQVLTTIPTGTYDYISGSSLAAAHVTGVIALLLELHPDLSTNKLYGFLSTSSSADFYQGLN